jgi:hypothetical protein|tara:strand:- start:322 stop:552 length:231 start_codon:yes stop_codon:yes gene_type:complete
MKYYIVHEHYALGEYSEPYYGANSCWFFIKKSDAVNRIREFKKGNYAEIPMKELLTWIERYDAENIQEFFDINLNV